MQGRELGTEGGGKVGEEEQEWAGSQGLELEAHEDGLEPVSVSHHLQPLQEGLAYFAMELDTDLSQELEKVKKIQEEVEQLQDWLWPHAKEMSQ